MPDLAVLEKRIPTMTEMAIDKVRQLEELSEKCPQCAIPTWHLFHAGMYVRTIMIPKGVMLTGALIKIATILILEGDAIVYIGEKAVSISGYQVLAASANRKQAFVAREDTYLTMIFKSDAKTVEEAEEQFTDESARLMSRHKQAENHITITGE